MRHPTLTVVFMSVGALVACQTPIDPPDLPTESASPAFTVFGGDNPNGAIVLNKGAATVSGNCRFGSIFTTDVTGVRAPSGAAQLSCHWEEFLPAGTFDKAVVVKGFNCFVRFGGFRTTNQSHFTLARSGVANMKCTFPPA